MTGCERIRADAPGLASLPPGDPERVAAEAHARGCPGCARALREAERLQTLLAAAEAEPLPAGALTRASRQIRAELGRERRRLAAARVAAVCVAVPVFVALARSRSPVHADWAAAAILWAVAAGLAALASRRPAAVAGLAPLAAIAAAAALGGPGPVAPRVGLECLATEVACAAAVVAAGWLALRGAATSPGRATAIAAAAAGALGGDAALQLTCAAHAGVPHLLAFHVAGVLLAAAGAALLWRAPARAAA